VPQPSAPNPYCPEPAPPAVGAQATPSEPPPGYSAVPAPAAPVVAIGGVQVNIDYEAKTRAIRRLTKWTRIVTIVTLALAIAANIVPEMLVVVNFIDINDNPNAPPDTIDCTQGFGLWLANANTKHKWGCGSSHNSPQYCAMSNEDPDYNNCPLGVEYAHTPCCHAWANKCRAGKSFGIMGTVSAALAFTRGIRRPLFGTVMASFSAASFAIIFAMTASLSSGLYYDGLNSNTINTGSDCGLSHYENVSPGAAFVLAVIAASLSAGQVVCFLKLYTLKKVIGAQPPRNVV